MTRMDFVARTLKISEEELATATRDLLGWSDKKARNHKNFLNPQERDKIYAHFKTRLDRFARDLDLELAEVLQVARDRLEHDDSEALTPGTFLSAPAYTG